jgi:prepilin-type N-terminal cleavage/methylation domain-containing protein
VIRQGRQGFTLVEMIGVIIVVAVAVPPSMMALREAAISRSSPIMFSRARWLATEKLEDIVADRHAQTRGYDFLVSANYPDEAEIAGFPDFARSVRFVETGPDLSTPGEGYMTVTVTVTWPDPKRGMRSLDIATVLTEYGG